MPMVRCVLACWELGMVEMPQRNGTRYAPTCYRWVSTTILAIALYITRPLSNFLHRRRLHACVHICRYIYTQQIIVTWLVSVTLMFVVCYTLSAGASVYPRYDLHPWPHVQWTWLWGHQRIRRGKCMWNFDLSHILLPSLSLSLSLSHTHTHTHLVNHRHRIESTIQIFKCTQYAMPWLSNLEIHQKVYSV